MGMLNDELNIKEDELLNQKAPNYVTDREQVDNKIDTPDFSVNESKADNFVQGAKQAAATISGQNITAKAAVGDDMYTVAEGVALAAELENPTIDNPEDFMNDRDKEFSNALAQGLIDIPPEISVSTDDDIAELFGPSISEEEALELEDSLINDDAYWKNLEENLPLN